LFIVPTSVRAALTIDPGCRAERLDSDTRTMRVEVDVANPKLELVPGMYALALNGRAVN
jgi:hypothetical protein